MTRGFRSRATGARQERNITRILDVHLLSLVVHAPSARTGAVDDALAGVADLVRIVKIKLET